MVKSSLYIRGVKLIFIQGPHTAQFVLMWAGSLKGRKDGRKRRRRKKIQEGKMEGRKGARIDGRKRREDSSSQHVLNPSANPCCTDIL